MAQNIRDSDVIEFKGVHSFAGGTSSGKITEPVEIMKAYYYITEYKIVVAILKLPN